jgi:hypothetical protein
MYKHNQGGRETAWAHSALATSEEEMLYIFRAASRRWLMHNVDRSAFPLLCNLFDRTL